jgi:hypothetical protein
LPYRYNPLHNERDALRWPMASPLS